jgi:hypothetical protein
MNAQDSIASLPEFTLSSTSPEPENKNLWKTSFRHDTSAPFAHVLDGQVTEILANDMGGGVEPIVEENWPGGVLRPEGPCCRSGGLGLWAECWVVRRGGVTSPNVLVSLRHTHNNTSYYHLLAFVHRIAPNPRVRPPVRFRFSSSVNRL